VLQTPLIDVHRRAGAKLVEFAGWELPLHYGSQIEEHLAVRRAAGMFDTSHMLAVDVEGAGARAFLARALANNVERLRQPGKAMYSCLLREDGGILDDLIVHFVREDLYRVVVNAACADKDLAWLQSLGPERTVLSPRRDLAMIAVQGPAARERTWTALPGLRAASEALEPFFGVQAGAVFVSRTGYTGEDGFELLLPAAQAGEAWTRLAGAGVRPCGLGARDSLRLEAGMNLYGQDMDQTTTPLECGLGWTVDLDSGRNFIGRRALATQLPTRSLLGLVLLGRGGVLRARQRVLLAQGEGETTSGGFSPTLQTSIALARVPARTVPGDAAEVELRGKRLAARVVRPPFVRRGRVLV